MKIRNCKTNHLVDPIGFDLQQVVLTWTTDETPSKKQKEARILIASEEEMRTILYDTGYQEGLDSRGVVIDLTLTPMTRYYWQVEVVGDLEDRCASDINFFETGKMATPWTGQWITTAWEDQRISPMMRQDFKTTKSIKQARVYIIGLGLYELEINGQRIGNERLTPYCNAYDAWLQYQTYDVTDTIKEGNNTIGVLLGNGWAKGKFGTFGDLNTPYIHDFALLGECVIDYTDGTQECIGTNTTWLCHPSAVVEDSLYDGEIFDANLVIKDWSKVGCDLRDWQKVRAYTPTGLGPVVDRLSPPVIVKETLKPIALLKTPAGETVIDMGQNMVGWLKIHLHEPKGTCVKLSFGEVLQGDNFYRENLRTAKQEYQYISDGEEVTVEPHFTFYGFRYVKVEGMTHEVKLEDFTGCVVYSDIDTIGRIETSDPLVNRLFLNALWGQKGNFLDVPTDCPQRDERMGWTGDAQVFAGTASFNMDTYAFYVKFMHDLYQEQKFAGGMVASTVPTFSQNKMTESSFVGGGACAWSDAATVIPWEVYLHTGDATILKRQYQSMKDWVDWIIRQDKASGDRKLWTVGFHFGDWLALDGPIEGGVMGGTDNGLLASAYYRLSTQIMSKTAQVLGYKEEATYYGELSDAIKKAIQDEFFSKNGRSTIQTQTAHVVALQFDLVEDEVKQRVLKDLKALLKNNHMHLKTGFIGTPYLCRSLSDHGESSAAYEIFFQEDYPSWLYEVIMGATTIWERWNSILPDGSISGTGMNSLNHYAYGSIVEWMYRNVCGMKPSEDNPGFKTFTLKPELYGKLLYAKASVDTAMGLIETGWCRHEDGQVTIEVTVPFNTQAQLYLPDHESTSLISLEAGHYSYTYQPTKEYALKYSIETPFYELLAHQETRQVLERFAPHLMTTSKDDLGFELPYSLAEVIKCADGFTKGMILRRMDVGGFEKAIEEIPYNIRTATLNI